MKGFVADIEELTEENDDSRRVLYTGENLQLVLMAIEPGGKIGEEVHVGRDQFFRIEKGKGEVVIDGPLESQERRSDHRAGRRPPQSRIRATSLCFCTPSTHLPSTGTAQCM